MASVCNNPSDNITEIRYFGTVRLLRPKQNKVLFVNMEYMDLLPPTAPSLVFARESCTLYCTEMKQVARKHATFLFDILAGHALSECVIHLQRPTKQLLGKNRLHTQSALPTDGIYCQNTKQATTFVAASYGVKISCRLQP